MLMMTEKEKEGREGHFCVINEGEKQQHKSDVCGATIDSRKRMNACMKKHGGGGKRET
jgi:hypothetical protein